MQRIYINVPYAEKDQAKLYGARWDAEVRRWYITQAQDAMLFQRWFSADPVKPVSQDRITLKEFLARNYGSAISLTYRSAKAFGIPYPLESGWAKKYADRTALLSSVTVGKKGVKNHGKRDKKLPGKFITGPKVFIPSCSCDVLPWEDCEHTEEAAHSAMLEMLSLK